jgi:hypothetical protein
MTTTRDVLAFLAAAQPWLEKHPQESKFRYAVKKVVKACTVLKDHYFEAAEDLDIEHCLEKDGAIQKDARGALDFSKDGLRKRNAARRALFEAPVEVTPFLGREPPDDLTEAEKDAFAGFVLPADDEEPA